MTTVLYIPLESNEVAKTVALNSTENVCREIATNYVACLWRELSEGAPQTESTDGAARWADGRHRRFKDAQPVGSLT